MGWTSSIHSKYNFTEDNDGKGVLVHNAPEFYLKGYIERTNATTIKYNITSISSYGGYFGFYYKLALKIGSQYIEILSLNQNEMNGTVTKNINKSGTVTVSKGKISVSIQVKCQATVEGAGCTILGKKDDEFSGYNWDTLPYFPVKSFNTEFVDPYTPPSNLSFTVKNITTKSLTVVPKWTNGTEQSTVTVTCYNGTAGVNSSIQSVTSGSSIVFNNLPHNTTYTISVMLADSRTTLNATDQKIKTQTITIGYDSEPSQYYLHFIFYPYIDGILNTTILKFYSILCLYNTDYEVGYAVPLNDSKTEFNITDLNYYTEYEVRYYVTDGYNIAELCVIEKTLLPCIRLYYNGNWVRAVPYIYSNNKWNLSVGMVCCKDENNVLKWHDTYYP